MLQAIIKRSSTTTSSSARGTKNRAMHKSPIFEGALSRTFTILSGLVENLQGSPQKILPPLPPPRSTKKRHVFQILDFFQHFQHFQTPKKIISRYTDVHFKCLKRNKKKFTKNVTRKNILAMCSNSGTKSHCMLKA